MNRFNAPDGTPLVFDAYEPPPPGPRAAVLFLNGWSDHAGRWIPTAQGLRDARFAAYLLDQGADPFGVGGDLLEASRDRGYLEMVKLLEDRFAGLFGASPKGEAVAAAIRERDLDRVRRLLDEAPELLQAGDARSNLPIHWAVMTRH